MSEPTIIKTSIERRTYLRGKLKGKYWAFIDHNRSDQKWENFYSIEIYEGELHISSSDLRKWDQGLEFEEFQTKEDFLLKIPTPINCCIYYADGTVKHYKLEIFRPTIDNPQLYNQLYEGERMFGTIEGELGGYFKHFDYEYKEIDTEKLHNVADVLTVIDPDNHTTNHNLLPSYGTVETRDNYSRRVTSNLKTGEFEWSKWSQVPSTPNTKQRRDVSNIFSNVFAILGVGYGLCIGLVVLFFAWRILIPIGGLWLFFILLSLIPSIFSNLFRWVLRVFSFCFFLYIVIGFFNIIKKPLSQPKKRMAKDEMQERLKQKDDVGYSDSIISNYRVWRDYQNIQYNASLEVMRSGFIASAANRINLPLTVTSELDYNTVVDTLKNFDDIRLNRLYSMFDSIRRTNSLSETRFAEVIVSCIQDIPYVLIVDRDCAAALYKDGFIISFINKGGNCEGNIKYGLFSPVEFTANLKGDCDTRALLLYTVLNHFDFDVAMLGSTVYRHSIIAINLPYSGFSKIIRGKNYVFWETTALGMKPGDIPVSISNPDYWQVNLLSKPHIRS